MQPSAARKLNPHGQTPAKQECVQEPLQASQLLLCLREDTNLPKPIPVDAVSAARRKEMGSGFGLLSCGGSGFPAKGEEVKSLLLCMVEAQRLLGRVFTCEKL